MTLSLTTSAGRLQDDVDHIMHSITTRSGAIKDRVQQSKQAKWLKRGRKGTHIFLMKLGERSRAIDWFWELWRDLGNDLPPRFEVVVPGLSTAVKLKIPEGDEVGDRSVVRGLSPDATIALCEEMLRNVVDVEGLQREKREQGDGADLDLELVWKTSDGALDWIGQKTNVLGKDRDWGVLAGVAISTVCIYKKKPRIELNRCRPKHASVVAPFNYVPHTISRTLFVSKTVQAWKNHQA
jgi:hypothetical protein